MANLLSEQMVAPAIESPKARIAGVSDSELDTRDLAWRDLPQVVELHKICFREFFLTKLGDEVLYRFYESALVDSGSVAAVLVERGTERIVGVAIGTLSPSFYTRLFRRHLGLVVWTLARGLATSPAVRLGMAERLKFVPRILRPKADDALARAGVPLPKGIEARFLGIAVHPQVRGGRSAERLVGYFAQRLFAAGAGRVGGSVKPGNLSSLILYKRLGWHVRKTGPDRVDVWIDSPS